MNFWTSDRTLKFVDVESNKEVRKDKNYTVPESSSQLKTYFMTLLNYLGFNFSSSAFCA